MPHTQLVTTECVRERRIHVDYVIKPLALGLEEDHAAQVVQQGVELVWRFHQVDLSRLDPGEVEDVVDNGEQVLSGVFHVAGVHADVRQSLSHHRITAVREALRSAPLPENHLVHAEHCVDGGSNLVGHVRQEVALGAVGALGAHLFLQQVPLHPHKGSHDAHRQQRRHEQ